MAWTAPRTWVTAETVTAALLNTHLRDNMLQTASAKVTTAGDIVYATASNALARLGVGGVNKFLGGGASAPIWTTTIGDASSNGLIVFKGTNPTVRWSETDAADPNDFWEMRPDNTAMLVRYWDDSAAAFDTATRVDPGDFILHTGNTGTGFGAVVIETDSLGSTGLTTGGTGALAVTITTGGPAYVIGWFSIALTRSASGSAGDELSIVPQDDGVAMFGAFTLADTDWADAMIPSNGDKGTYSGFFYDRVTSTNTSTWSVNLSASVNSVFTAVDSRLIVISVQYPT